MTFNDWIPIIVSVIGLFLSAAALFAGIGYFRQGKDSGKLSTNQLLKEQIDALEGKVNTQTEDIEKMSREIHDLKEAIDIRDKKFAEAILLLQGRDPQMQELMKGLKEYAEMGTPVLKNITERYNPIMESLKEYLEIQPKRDHIFEKLDKHLEGQKVVGKVLSQ